MASQKALAVVLSKVPPFQRPKEGLEQYRTDADIAAELLWHAHMRGRIEGKVVADLGAGTGILGIGALLLGASKVHFVEKDPLALEELRTHVEAFCEAALGEWQLHQMDVKSFHERADMVIENPPFGTRERHEDGAFLSTAMACSSIIYSLHLSGSIPAIRTQLKGQGFSIEEELTFRFPLPRTLEHHRRNIHRIDVTGIIATKAL